MSGAGAAGAVLGIIGGVIGAIGNLQAGAAAEAAGEYNARIMERNAVVAEQTRQTALRTSEVAASDAERERRRTLGAMRASYGASGLEMSGSPLDVLQDTATEMALDEARIRHEGKVRSAEISSEILGFQESATMSRMEGKQARTASYFNAASSLLGGISSAVGSSAGRSMLSRTN